MLDVKEAIKELRDKTLEDIQRETAWKWASRACAAFQKASEQKSLKDAVKWLLEAEEYKHEAIEHAALIDKEDNKLLKDIVHEIHEFQKKTVKLV
jgi:hypothetical protein